MELEFLARSSLALLRGRSHTLQNSRSREAKALPIRKFLRSDVEGIESIGAVGAVFEQVFFGLGEFFAGLIFAEAVATVGDTG